MSPGVLMEPGRFKCGAGIVVARHFFGAQIAAVSPSSSTPSTIHVAVSGTPKKAAGLTGPYSNTSCSPAMG